MKLTIELRVKNHDDPETKRAITVGAVPEWLASDQLANLWDALNVGERIAIKSEKGNVVGFISLEDTNEL